MIRILLLFTCILFICPNGFALERFDIVTTQTLKNMLEQRTQGKENFILINTLDKLIADHHTIPGSINIPWNNAKARSQELGKDKGIPIITYCLGYR